MACETAPGRSMSFFFGSIAKAERPPIFFFSFALIDQIHIVFLHFCCMRHFNECCSCSVVGLHGLPKVGLRGETSCFLKPHMFTSNASTNAYNYRHNLMMSLWCEKLALFIIFIICFFQRTSPRFRSAWSKLCFICWCFRLLNSVLMICV